MSDRDPTIPVAVPSAEEKQWAMFAHLSALAGALLTIPLYLVICIASLVFIIVAAIKANEGTAYRYPVSLRLVK